MRITPMTLGLLGALALMPAAVMASAPIKWVYASQSQDGTGRWYYDQNSVTRTGTRRTFVTREDEPNGDTTFLGTEVNCSNQSYRLVWFMEYENGVKAHTSTDPSSWLFYSSDSNIGHVAEDLC